jgi:hypothetical protein
MFAKSREECGLVLVGLRSAFTIQTFWLVVIYKIYIARYSFHGWIFLYIWVVVELRIDGL